MTDTVTLKQMKMKNRAYRKFEKNRFKANGSCPCGKNNRDGKFATELGYAGQPIGYCNGCAKSFWSNSETIVKPYELREEDIPSFCSPDTKSLIDSFDEKLESGFAKFLVDLFGEYQAVKIVEMYYLGLIDSASGSQDPDVIFWQLDADKNLRAGKVMEYNDKGKRQGIPRWWHKINGNDCQLNQCFFGEHLIYDLNKPIAVVESEKTAAIMSYVNPTFIWLACGSSTNLQDSKCSLLSKYQVTLFPDHKQYERWKEKADKWGFDISRDCEIMFEEGLISEGDDIADYFINLARDLKSKIKKIDPEWSGFKNEIPKD